MNNEYTLIRSKRKTLSLEINKDLKIIIRVPNNCPQEQVDIFISSHSKWIKEHMKVAKKRYDSKLQLSDENVEYLKQQAKELLPLRTKYFSQIMQLIPSAVKITAAKTRFGSCSGKNSICFSYILMLYPKEAIDYVVVHELAHIKHKNHSLQFYSLIKQYMPNYKEYARLLENPPVGIQKDIKFIK